MMYFSAKIQQIQTIKQQTAQMNKNKISLNSLVNGKQTIGRICNNQMLIKQKLIIIIHYIIFYILYVYIQPDAIVRVSEYIPEIINYIKKIIENGFAYESNQSVYFNVEKFHCTQNQCYAKLEPQSVNNKQKLDDGEGKLGVKNDSEKRSQKDFALWKASKPNEPEWDSPWGKGRPGWHIECSTMASEILGYPLDIHMGGEDLKFPHHDNEIAQSEAYFNKEENNQWVNYFMHTGHLHIEGLKMAKSLKNFISIKNLIQRFSSRVLRLIFTKQNYDSIMDYSENTLEEYKIKDKKFSEFFITINAILLQFNINISLKWEKKEFVLNEFFQEKQALIHKHFQNNFNIPKVIGEIEEIIRQVNIYLKEKPYIYPLLLSISNYVKYIFYCIGICYDNNNNMQQQEDIFVLLINEISSFRDNVRGSGQDFVKIQELSQNYQDKLNKFASKKNINDNTSQAFEIATYFYESVLKSAQEQQHKNILYVCDTVRDEKLIHLGVRIDDGKPGEQSLWKFDDKEILLKEKEEKQLKQAQQQEALKKKEQEKIKQMSVNPSDMFRNDIKYKNYQFNDKGIPTHDDKGQVLKDKAVQSFQKKWDAQNILQNFEIIINKNINLIMEYLGDISLFQYVKQNKKISKNEAITFFLQILDCLYYLHSNNIYHRDIKLQNILLDKDKNIKIIDFGFSIISKEKLKTVCGTLSYMAPELIEQKDYYGQNADLWASGVVFYTLLCGNFPFKGIDDKSLIKQIHAQNIKYDPTIINEEGQQFFNKILNINPNNRLSIQQVIFIKHYFITQNKKRLEIILLLNKNERKKFYCKQIKNTNQKKYIVQQIHIHQFIDCFIKNQLKNIIKKHLIFRKMYNQLLQFVQFLQYYIILIFNQNINLQYLNYV
ncbi:hypothetical protein IMG5_047670 [Ichthyophthirius multifiliis]|uniref:Protein kinase domain-containing protein n=1 Tax=Ichthyophthirius multifiliis TaxID=5932 RepID=G0QMC7_ICHMU|nr:hypothetical protein IMG5_047670 [Ichthyophthirius multifiliis]EGR33621.1 hypothetical protein IMG5_047670 [Ichthyophthirius multifiliis]|eukprot:XP_004037607.1 hypothetical protein IMG5_047670 [Ichthyophthirius multifiliis]